MIGEVEETGYVPGVNAPECVMAILFVPFVPVISNIGDAPVVATPVAVVALKAEPSMVQVKVPEPVPQGEHEPPQSTPVSVPFCMPSVQVGLAWQALGQGPPQSTPNSPPS